MSDLLSIGASGVRAYQTALGTVSDNIANVGTVGYSRRVAKLEQVTGAPNGLASINRVGNGVTVDSIDRQADLYQAQSVRTASADLARTETGTNWLTRIQSVLTDGAAGKQVTGFFAAAQRLAADPTSLAARSATMEAARNAGEAFARTGRALDATAAELDSVMADGAQQLTALGAGLAKVNDGIARAAQGSASSAALLDQRDRILEQMSALTDVAAQFDPVGRATVRLGAGGPPLVVGSEAATVSVNRNDDGTVAFVASRAGTDTVFTPTGGSFAGMAEGVQRIADTRKELNKLAGGFAETVNTRLEAGDDLAGADGKALFTIGTPATELTLAFDDPKLLAAAARDGGPRDGSNMLLLQGDRTTNGVEGGLSSLTAGVAATIAGRATVSAAQTAIREAAISARDAGSGVDLDREAVDLMRFQQAYQASSRVIQAARDIFQSILSIN